MTVWTIGYEGLSVEQFLELLSANRVEHLVDIREAPISRKPGFAKAALAEAVGRLGIRYSHVRALGCPKPIRDRYRRDGDWSRYTRDFKIYLAAQAPAIAELRAGIMATRTCLLCYEADFHRCHRSFVAEAVAGEPLAIRHLLARRYTGQKELPIE